MAVKFVKDTTKPKPIAPEWHIDTEIEGDAVYVTAKNHSGDVWYLFKIKADGTFYREPFIPADSGFKLDKNGRIVESKTL